MLFGVPFTTTFGSFVHEFSPLWGTMSALRLTRFKKVRYLRATVEDSNFCRALLIHDLCDQVGHESLQREFGTESLTFASELSRPAG